MNRYLLKLSFDGSGYHGWQVQPNGLSVQEQLQHSLEKLLNSRPNITGCSRTDAGVHARTFFCHFDCALDIPPDGLVKGLNSVMPKDIRALACRIVPGRFHCRYHALGKQYLYEMDTAPVQSPFRWRYAYHCPRPLNVDAMNQFCAHLIGTHDFYGFSASGRSVDNTVRTVSDCSVQKCDDKIVLSITADGFLYNMVRIVAGTALACGFGQINPDDTPDILMSLDRSRAGQTLPPNGLYLNKVYYENTDF